MTSSQAARQVRMLLTLLMESEIAIAMNPVIEDHLGIRTRVTWSSARPATGLFSSLGFATVDEYCAFIDGQEYSAILYDGALVQISYDFVARDLVGHRLCYYPCPFDMDEELLLTDPVADTVMLYRDASSVQPYLRSPCRFDYDESNATSGHPSVHMHLIKPYCRWPVTRPLSIGDFIRFVFRNFYPNLWAVHPFLREWSQQRIANRTILPEEEAELHVACGHV